MRPHFWARERVPTKGTKSTKEDVYPIKALKLTMANIIYREESYRIIGACFEVYKSKGCGFTEPIYQECMAIELTLQNIPYVQQARMDLEYKGTKLEQFFRVDFVCYGTIIELKALPKLTDVCRSQVLNYLNGNKFRLGLLVNFGHHPRLEYERIVV